MNGAALHSHIEARTYDTSNRLRSRSLPGAGASDEYFEVFTYATETVNSIFKTTGKRALTAVWPPEVLPSGSAAPSDPKNESSSTTYYEL